MQTPSSRSPTSRAAAALVLAASLAGCASFSPDGGFGAIEATARERLGKDLAWARTLADADAAARRVAELLARPLSADDAVQLALLNHRGLQARFADLGITEAEVVQAGRLPNPGFSFGRLKSSDGVEIERAVHLSLARLIALPLVQQVQARRFERLQRDVAADMLALAADARRAWVVAVAAAETTRYMRQVKDAAEAGAELARRMEQAGNFNKLARAREQGFYADAALRLVRAERAERAARERLTRLLGLWGAQTAFALPERLPELPAEPQDEPDIERRAMARRLDVQAARLGVEQTARNLGLTRAVRFVDVLELGLVRNTLEDGARQTGYEIGFELPLFDWGTSRVARAEAVYRQALDRAAQIAIDARSEVREAYGHYRSAWDEARHQRDEIVPLRQRISDEQLLRYNGMLIGVFELLADARAQIAAVNGAIESLRDFWLAQADLEMALTGKPTLAPPRAASASAAPAAMAADGGTPH